MVRYEEPKRIAYLFACNLQYYLNRDFIVTDVPSMIVLDKSGLKITFRLERPPDIPDLLVINMLAQNSGSTILTDFLFQAAVPRVGDEFYTCISFVLRNVTYVLYFPLTDIPATNVVAIEHSHSTVWSSNSSIKSYKYE